MRSVSDDPEKLNTHTHMRQTQPMKPIRPIDMLYRDLAQTATRTGLKRMQIVTLKQAVKDCVAAYKCKNHFPGHSGYLFGEAQRQFLAVGLRLEAKAPLAAFNEVMKIYQITVDIEGL